MANDLLISSASCHFYISSNIPISLRNLIIFSTSQSFVVMSLCHSGYCFFLLSLHWGQSCRQFFIVRLWFPLAAFPHVGCWLFFDIKWPWVSLVCPIRILFSLTSYCLQLLWALSHSAMCGLMQYSLLIMFFYSLCHSVFLALMVR